MAREVRVRRKPSKARRVTIQAKKPDVTAIGRALRMVGGLGGRYLGGMAGLGDAGSSVGTGLGAQLSRWLGQGDYSVSANTLVRESASGIVPSMHKNDQTVVVRHKEFITEVSGKTAFTVQRRFSINPGLSTTFPWLAGVASQYSEYRIRGMVYHYVPTSGDAVSSTNAALGSVMLQTSYRANEPVASSKVELLNEYWSNESKPSEAFCHPIECDPLENPFNIQYIRTGAVPSTDNVLFYDLGTTTLAVSGQQADDIVLGDLWCTYEIELRKPRLTDLTGESAASFSATATTSINSSTCLGTNVAELQDLLPGGATISSTAITIAQGNVGTYLLAINWVGVTAIAVGTTTISGTGSATVNVFGSAFQRGTIYTVGTDNPSLLMTFKITNPNTTTVITPICSVLTNASAMNLVLTRINPALIL